MKTCDVRTPSATGAEKDEYSSTMTKIIANDGDKAVRLVAEFRAWPQIIVKWYKENRELQNGSKYGSIYENSVAELIIKNIVKHDAGSYTVVASSPFGEALLSADLVVEDAATEPKNGNTHLLPSILVQPLSDQMIRVGKKARFTVAASFPPEPQVHWYKGKERFGESDRFQISKQGGVCTLDIMMVEPSDDGVWKCEVITNFGYAVSLANLHAIVPKGYRKPEFLEGLKALLTEQGTVSLECKVVGVPTPLLRWFKDGKEIKAGDMFNLRMQGNDESSLGTYTCVAINCMGKAVSSAQVTVMEKTEDKLKPKVKVEDPVPLFLENLDDKTIKVGENLRFTVRVRTPPSVQVHWYNQEEEVEPGEKFHLTQVDDGIFHLDVIPVEITDKGEWRCVAINQYGKATSACNLTLTVPKSYRSPEFVEDLQAIFTDDGLVSFECKVVGIPTPILRWYKDGLELKPGDVHQLSGTNSLGSYSCVAKNCMGLASSLAELTLEDIYGAKERRKPPAKHPPRFTQHLKDEIVVIGDSFRFTISVTCPPVPEITWYKDNIRVEEVARYHLRRERNGIYHLDVDMLEISDQGSWKCLAVNDYGHSLTQCGLKVIVPKQYKKPKFIEHLRAVLSEEGTVSLECKVVGVPQPTLKWYKDGIELKAGDIYKIVSGEGGTSSLGTYTCEARNCMGMASSTAALLAFDDKYLRDRLRTDAYQHELSTIEERSEFSTYGTPSLMDNWDESKADMEFSIYETPDITEDEARQIIEMFADEVSEYISTKEAPELPPLRFIKESAMVGNILMEAIIIDVPIECCSRVEDMSQKTPIENLATEADIADISIMDPVVVDLPYDYSEAASLHELKIDFSAEGEVLIKDASMKEAIIIEAQIPLASQESNIEGISMENLAAKAEQKPVEKSVLQPLVVTAPEQLHATGENVIETIEFEHVAVEVHIGDGMEAAINASGIPPVLYNEQEPIDANMLEISSEHLQQQQQQHQADDTNVQRPTTFDQGEAISDDITPSENLGTEADVESIASLEEFATDYVNGFADEPMESEEYFPALTPLVTTGEGLEIEAEIQRIQENVVEIERSTPNFESALEGYPDELLAELQVEGDLMATTPTPTTDIQKVLTLEDYDDGAPLALIQTEDGGSPIAASLKANEPGLLAELASTVLQRAAEGIMTTAVIAESLVAAAASMILPPEERQGTSRDSFEEQAFALEESVAEKELAQIERQSLIDQEMVSKIIAAEVHIAEQFLEESVQSIDETHPDIATSSEIYIEIENNVFHESVEELPAQTAVRGAGVKEGRPILPLEVYNPDELNIPPSELITQDDIVVEKANVQLKEADAIIHHEAVLQDDKVDNLSSLPERDIHQELAVMIQEPVDAVVTEVHSCGATEEPLPILQEVESLESRPSESVAQCHLVIRSVSLQESITPEEPLDDIAAAGFEIATATLVDSSLQNICIENPTSVLSDLGQQVVEDKKLSLIVEEEESEVLKVDSPSEIPDEEHASKKPLEQQEALEASSESIEGNSRTIVDKQDSEESKNEEVQLHDPNKIMDQIIKPEEESEQKSETLFEPYPSGSPDDEQIKAKSLEQQEVPEYSTSMLEEFAEIPTPNLEEQASQRPTNGEALPHERIEILDQAPKPEEASEQKIASSDQETIGQSDVQASSGLENSMRQSNLETSALNEVLPAEVSMAETASFSLNEKTELVDFTKDEFLTTDTIEQATVDPVENLKEVIELESTLLMGKSSELQLQGEELPKELREENMVQEAEELIQTSELSRSAGISTVPREGELQCLDILENDLTHAQMTIDPLSLCIATATTNEQMPVETQPVEIATNNLEQIAEQLTETSNVTVATIATEEQPTSEAQPIDVIKSELSEKAESLVEPLAHNLAATVADEALVHDALLTEAPTYTMEQTANEQAETVKLTSVAAAVIELNAPEMPLSEIMEVKLDQTAGETMTELDSLQISLESTQTLCLAAAIDSDDVPVEAPPAEMLPMNLDQNIVLLTDSTEGGAIAAIVEEKTVLESLPCESAQVMLVLAAVAEIEPSSLTQVAAESLETTPTEVLYSDALGSTLKQRVEESLEKSDLSLAATVDQIPVVLEMSRIFVDEALKETTAYIDDSILPLQATDVDSSFDIKLPKEAETSVIQEVEASIKIPELPNKDDPSCGAQDAQSINVDATISVQDEAHCKVAGKCVADSLVQAFEELKCSPTEIQADSKCTEEASPLADATNLTAAKRTAETLIEACASEAIVRGPSKSSQVEIQTDSLGAKEILPTTDTAILTAAQKTAEKLIESCVTLASEAIQAEMQADSKGTEEIRPIIDTANLNAANRTAATLIESCVVEAIVQGTSESSQVENKTVSTGSEEILPIADHVILDAAQKTAEKLMESCMTLASETIQVDMQADGKGAEEIRPVPDTTNLNVANRIAEALIESCVEATVAQGACETKQSEIHDDAQLIEKEDNIALLNAARRTAERLIESCVAEAVVQGASANNQLSVSANSKYSEEMLPLEQDVVYLNAANQTAYKLAASCLTEAIIEGASETSRTAKLSDTPKMDEIHEDQLQEAYSEALLNVADRLAEELVASCILDAFDSLAEVIALLRKELQNLPEVSESDCPLDKHTDSVHEQFQDCAQIQTVTAEISSIVTVTEMPASTEADQPETKKAIKKKKKKTSKSSPSTDETPVVIPELNESSSIQQDDQSITCQILTSANEQCTMVTSEVQLDKTLIESASPLDAFSKQESHPDIKDVPECFSSVIIQDNSAIILESVGDNHTAKPVKGDQGADKVIMESESQESAKPQEEQKKSIQELEKETSEQRSICLVVATPSSESLENSSSQKENQPFPKNECNEQEGKCEPKKTSKKRKASSVKKTSSTEVDETEQSKEMPSDAAISKPTVDQTIDPDTENKENIHVPQDTEEQVVIQSLSEGILTDKLDDNSQNVDSDISQEIPKSEGGKEISRLKRSTSRKDKRRRSSKKSEDGDSQSRRSSRTDSRDSSTGDLTDEGEDFAAMSLELSREKRLARTVSGGDLAQIHEIEELSQTVGQRRRSCPTVECLPQIKEQLEQLPNIVDDDGVNVEKETEDKAMSNGDSVCKNFENNTSCDPQSESSLTRGENLKEPPDKPSIEVLPDATVHLQQSSKEADKHSVDAQNRDSQGICENGVTHDSAADLPAKDQNELKKDESKASGKKSAKGKTKKGTRKSSKDEPEVVQCVNGSLDPTSPNIASKGGIGENAILNGNECTDKVSSDQEIGLKIVSSKETSEDKGINAHSPSPIGDRKSDDVAEQTPNGDIHVGSLIDARNNDANILPKSETVDLDQDKNRKDTEKDEGIEKGNKDQESNREMLAKHEKSHEKEIDKSTETELEKSEDKSSGYSTEDGKSIQVEDASLNEAKTEKSSAKSIEASVEVAPEKQAKVKKTKKSKQLQEAKTEPSKNQTEQKIEERPKTDEATPMKDVEGSTTKSKTTKIQEPTVAEDMAKLKHELLALDLEMKPSKLFIEELNSSFEDSSTDKTPTNVVIESVSDDADDTLKNLDDDATIKEIDDSLMEVEEIPLDDLSMEDVIENMRTLRRLQTITEVDEITDDDDGGQHIVIATLRPCWEDDISRRAHSLQPAKEQITHTVETIRRCSSGDVPDQKKTVKTKDTPVFIMKLQDLTVPVGYRMRLTCCVIGTPEPTIQWLKNGFPISVGMGYREITDFGICILEISRAGHSDSGEYTCIAKNDHGEDRTSGKLTVRGKSKPGLVEPAFTRSILDMKGHSGDSITMDCTVIGWPTPNVAWVKDGHPLELDDRIEASVTSGGTHRLVIQEARCEDSGVYKCMAQNALGKDEITAAVKIMDKGAYRTSRFVRDSLTKKSRASSSLTAAEHGTFPCEFVGEVPKFQAELRDRTAHLGSTVTFQCEITGKPKPELTWLHNGRTLTPSRHVKLSQQGNTYTLTLLDSSYSDLGMYTCKASNSGGTTYTSGCLHFGLQDEDLEFGLAPVFITKPSSVNVGKHDEIVLACKVEGRPRPKVTWLKGARDMSLSRRAYKDSKGDIHKLVIHRAMNVDDGEYIVEARNKLGKEVVRCSVSVNSQCASGDEDDVWDYHRTTTALNVLRGYRPYVPQKELPGPIGGEPKVTDTGRNWVTLVWPRPIDDGGSSIMAYRIEACELPGHAWEEVGLSPITMCDVYNLKPESKYLFRVSARNMFGWGQPVSMSDALAIARRPDMPHFTSVPPSCVQAAVGSDVTLECLISGKPEPVMTWFKDRERIRAMVNSRFQMRFDGVSAKLTIRDVQADDEGCYMCEATSDGGRVTTFSVVAVTDEPASTPPRSDSRRLSPEEPSELPPVFSMRLRDRTVQVNNLVRLTCQVQGLPPPIVTWFKDGRKVRIAEYEIFQEDNFQTLEIPKASEDDSGEYTVVASNRHGEIACKCRVVVDRDYGRLSHPPTFSKQLEDLVVTKGDTASLHCKVVHLGGRATWFQDGQKLPHCRKYRMKTMPDGTCVLSILQVTTTDAGTYTCVASNQSGTTASTCNLKVDNYSSTDGECRGIGHEFQTHVGYSKPPVFLTKPRSTEVVEYDNVELICEVIGDPKPEVLWLRDGLTFKYQKDPEHFIRLGDGPFYRLDIPSVTIDDTGTYAVVARNCHGDTKAIISLQVFARGQGIEEAMSYKSQTKAGRVATRPEVTQTLKDLRCAYGDSVAFECHINATPVPEIRWEKDGHVLHSSEDFRLYHEGPICRLKITEVFPEDQGEYVCVAYNDAGKVSTSATLTVQKSEEKENAYNQPDSMEVIHQRPLRKRAVVDTPTKSKKKMVGPKFITNPHSRIVDEGDTVKFTCSIAGHPEPLVQWDKLGRLIKSDGRFDLVNREDLHSLIIRDVVPADAGMYTVTASNSIGRVYASAKLEVIAKRKGRIAVPSPNPASSGLSHLPPCIVPTKGSRVITITAYEVPTVHQPLSDTRVQRKERLFMSCEISGNPTPTVSWLWNETKIKNSRTTRCKFNGRLATLEVDKVQEKAQEAWVTCKASNSHGAAKTTAKLTITECRPCPTKTANSSAIFGSVGSKTKSKTTPPKIDLSPTNAHRGISKEPLKVSNTLVYKKKGKSLLSKLNCGAKCVASDSPSPLPSQKSPCQPPSIETFRQDKLVLSETYSDAMPIASPPQSPPEYEDTLSHLTLSSLHLADLCTDLSPTFLQQLADVVVRDGQNVTLSVQLSGHAPFEVIWVHNDQEIANCDDTRYVSYEDNKYALVIADIFPEDSGLYTCECYNAFGHAETSCKVLVKEPAVLPQPSTAQPSFEVGLSERTECADGDHLLLTVQVTGTPNPVVNWFKDGQKLKSRFRITTRQEETRHLCYFSRVRLRDAGIYSAVATNNLGKATTSTALSIRTHLPPSRQMSSSSEAESIISPLCNGGTFEKHQEGSSATVPLGEQDPLNDTIPCGDHDFVSTAAEGNPKTCAYPSVPTLRNVLPSEVEIHSSNQVEEKEELIRNVHVEDCPKPSDILVAAVPVIKESPAQIIRGPLNTTVLQGQKAVLKVHFIGKPQCAVKWIKGGKMMECSERIRMETCEEMSCLSLDNVHSDDSGKYIVVVENTHGADCHFASLAVEGPPNPPASKPMVSQITSSSVTLCWYGSAFDGGSVLTGYIIEMAKADQDGHWQVLKSNCHSTSYIVNGLELGAEYIFRIRAQNVHGVSGPSMLSDPVLISGKESSDDDDIYDFHSSGISKVPTEIADAQFSELYDVQECLGNGRFGRVHRVIQRKTQEEYAAKFIRCRNLAAKENVRQEVAIMSCLRHPKLMRLVSAFEMSREMVIIMEYISGGALFERVTADDFDATEKDCILFTRQICEGVRYMHEKFVIHLDLKPENIMCLHRDTHQIKLIDFGLAKRYDPHKPTQILCGTPEFVAPEVINFDPISPATDMWSVGVVCYTLLAGESPFVGANEDETYSNVTRSVFDFEDESFEEISEDAKNFISALIVKKKEKRLTAQECLKHNWLAQQERTMSSAKLCKDKLKKFIIRRKWQKTGNAILALGRMTTMSGLSPRRSPFKTCNSFGGSFSDYGSGGSDCDTLSSVSSHALVRGTNTRPEVDQESLLADSSSESKREAYEPVNGELPQVRHLV